jgi:hypothetical protein
MVNLNKQKIFKNQAGNLELENVMISPIGKKIKTKQKKKKWEDKTMVDSLYNTTCTLLQFPPLECGLDLSSNE